ncbi:TPA: hypothetical protein ACJI3N_002680, partial [Raoultella planticola]
SVGWRLTPDPTYKSAAPVVRVSVVRGRSVQALFRQVRANAVPAGPCKRCSGRFVQALFL